MPPPKLEQLNYALVAKAHTPMYLMHKWWARKPHNVVAEYIKHYTKEGDVVLDPFVGSGVTALEAIKEGRKAIAIDLDPMATFITRMTGMPADLKEYEEEFKKIEAIIKDKIMDFYKTKCPKCRKDAIIICTHWENSDPVKIMFKCPNCKIKDGKNPDKEDFDRIKETEKMKIPYWYPTTRLYYNSSPFMKKEKNESLVDLFTKRNLICLSIIFNQINKISNSKIQDFMKFTFTSMVHLASKMCPVRPTRQFSSFWPVHSYWVPPVYMESNVWLLFKSAATGKQGILAGKEDSNAQINFYKEAKKNDELNDSANIFIKMHNALELTDIIPQNSVDYIFTDPPYGGAVQYFELSTLWASWLGMDLDYKDEITVNRQQEKDFEYYHKMLKAAFRQMYLVLKSGKYMTVTFHSTDIKVWNSIVKAVVMAGFELEKILYQPPARPSAKGLLQPYGSAVGDYYIRFRKPEKENNITERQMDMKSYELEVVDAAKRIVGERGEPTIYQHILNGIMVELKGGRHLPIGAKNIDDILKDYVGKEFELIDIRNEKGKIVGKKWWLKGKDLTNFSTPALSDRVERVVLNVLDKKIKASFDDVLQSIFIEFPNALTPDTQDIREVLEEYAEPTTDGKWRLKPGLTEETRQTMHSKMIYILAVLGKKAGYDTWIGLNEQKQIYGKQKLSELCDKVHAWRFVPQLSDILNRIKQIDVLWLEDGRIRYEFEVENTTGITDAIIRGSNIQDTKPKRFIVIPKEREGLLHRRLQEPIIKQSLEKDEWNFIKYEDLENLFNKYTKKNKFDANELESISRPPKPRIEKQENLNNFE